MKKRVERFGFRSIHTKLFLFFLVVGIVPIGILGVIAYQQVEQDAMTIAASESLRFSSLLLTDAFNALGDNDPASVIEDTYNNYHVKDPQTEEFRTGERYVVFADIDGNILYSTHPEGFRYSLEEMTSFKEVLLGKEGFVVEQYENVELVTFNSLGRILVFTHQDLDHVLQLSSDFRNKMLGFGAIVLVLIILFSLLISTTMSAPIRNLIKACDEVKRGNYNPELIPVKSDDEIGYLQECFSDMVDELKKKRSKK